MLGTFIIFGTPVFTIIWFSFISFSKSAYAIKVRNFLQSGTELVIWSWLILICLLIPLVNLLIVVFAGPALICYYIYSKLLPKSQWGK